MTNIISGVIHNNSATWLHEDICNGIDLDYEAHCCDCPGDDGYHDDCWESVGNEDILIGFVACNLDDPGAWFKHIGEHGSFAYKPDDKAEYSAIVGEVNTQIVLSRYVTRAAMCSPCYPGQADLDTPGQHLAYSLPPDLYDDDDDKPLIAPVLRTPGIVVV